MSVVSTLPSVLVAVASILVDASFPPERYQDRIGAQILLWLAASLQRREYKTTTTTTTTWTLVNLVLFCSIVSAAWMAWRMRQWERPSVIVDYSKRLAPSCIVPLIMSIVGDESTQASHDKVIKTSVGLFGITFFILCACKWYSVRNRNALQGLSGIPVVVQPSSTQHAESMDESTWHKWTPSQVLQWISSLDNNAEEWHSICGMLAPERIPGSVLGSLTVDDLRSMGVPFGMGCLLEEHIVKLTARYPHPQLYDHNYYNESREHNQDLLLSDGWLQEDGNHRYSDSEMLQSQPPKSFVDDNTGVDDEIAQKAQELMRERFGLELPMLRTNTSTNNDNQDASESNPAQPATSERTSHPLQQDSHVAQQPMTSETSLYATIATHNQADLDGIPPALLAAMPPHIREIAARKPHLVRQLLASQRSNQAAAATKSKAPSLSKVQEIRMQADPNLASRFVGAQAAAELAGMEVHTTDRHVVADEEGSVSSQEGEHAALLRRRSAR